MPTPRARAINRALLAVLILLATATVVAIVLAEGERRDHRQAERLVTSQRAGCERSRADRIALRDFMRTAAAVRQQGGDYSVARQYARLADGVDGRIVDCETAFPLP